MIHFDENDNAAVLAAIGPDAFAKLKQSGGSRLLPIHSSDDHGSVNLGPARSWSPVLFVDRHGDPAVLAGVLTARLQNTLNLVGMACFLPADVTASEVAGPLEPLMQELCMLAGILRDRLSATNAGEVSE